MKVGAIFGKESGGIVEKPDLVPTGEVVVVKIHSIPLCTEYHAFKEGHASDCLGHEAAGEVVAVSKSSRVRIGDRVVVQPQYACGHCFLCQQGDHIHCQNQCQVRGNGLTTDVGTATIAQYILKPDYLLSLIPDNLTYDNGAMACCGLGPTFGAMELLEVDAFDTVLITGLGPVGLGGVINARYRGARVIGVESHPYRANLARALGAEAVIDPKDPDAVQQVRALTGGVGASKAVETSGTASAKTFLVDAVRRKGRIAFVGWGGQIEVNTLISKGLTLYGAWHYNIHLIPRLFQLIQNSSAAIDTLITHRFPLSQIQDAWELQVSGNCGKVVLHPWD